MLDISGTIATHALIKGKKVKFDGCSDQPLSEAEKFHTPDHWVYLGSGYTIYYSDNSHIKEKKNIISSNINKS